VFIRGFAGTRRISLLFPYFDEFQWLIRTIPRRLGSAFPQFVQKNIKKSIDGASPLCHSDGTHGNINTQIK
jgi:hypothetical protein